MFDEIFNRWINFNYLTNDDIIPLFLEWNNTFGDGRGTAQEVSVLTNLIHTDYHKLMNKILHDVGVKKGYRWEEVWDLNSGQLLKRFLVK